MKCAKTGEYLPVDNDAANNSKQDSLSAAEAKSAAQRIAFGPLVFQAVVALRELGLLDLLWKRRHGGCSVAEAAHSLSITEYAVTVLFESADAAGVLREEDSRYSLS